MPYKHGVIGSSPIGSTNNCSAICRAIFIQAEGNEAWGRKNLDLEKIRLESLKTQHNTFANIMERMVNIFKILREFYAKMILLDTNVLTCLAGIEENSKVDLAKLESFVNRHTCACAKHSFFELLSNSHFSFEEKMQVLKYMKDHRIEVSTDSEIMKDLNPALQHSVKNDAFYNLLKKSYGKHIYPEIINNIHFFVICYPYICLTIYLYNALKEDSEGKEYFRKKVIPIQKEIDGHIKKRIQKIIMDTLECDNVTAKQLKESLSNLVANIMSYYYQLLAFAKELIESKSNIFFYKIIKRFKCLKTEILKDPLCKDIEYDHNCLSILRVLLDMGASDDSDKTIRESIVKNALFEMAKESICYPNKNMQNSFEEFWLQRKLESLLMKCGKINKNDFMDYGVMQEAYYWKRVRMLLTFDDDIIHIMDKIKDSEMFQNSVKTIKSFKKPSLPR